MYFSKNQCILRWYVRSYGIPEESLPKEYKEAKDLYVKNKQVACKICFHFMRSNNVKKHMKVHQKYSSTNKTPQSEEDICRDLVLEIVDKIVTSKEESSGIKQKHEEVECEAQTTIDVEALEKSALK